MSKDKKITIQPAKCDVCVINPSIGVACSPLGPVSHSYCHECLKQCAVPLWLCFATLDACGGDVADWVKKCIKSFKDGKYIDWKEAAALYPAAKKANKKSK